MSPAAAMTQADLERFCDDWFRAWTGGDAERLVAFYAEDAWYEDPARPQGIQGREALRRYFGKLLPANPEMAWTRRALWPVEGGAQRASGASASSSAEADCGFVVSWTARIPVKGETLVERGMDLVLLRDGLIARNEVYFDLARWSRALGR